MPQPPRLTDLADDYVGAVTFLAYFHYCNKGIFPFSEECKDQELRNLAELDDSALAFVHDTRRYVADHSKFPLLPMPEPPRRHGASANRGSLPRTGQQWQELWDGDKYENDYYFVSQLFEPNWQPRSMG